MKSRKQNNNISDRQNGRRLKIAFFDYPDVFEDFYPHYGVSQKDFATQWHYTANHAWLKIIQREVGDVNWYVTAIHPEITEGIHSVVNCRVKFVPSSWLHRQCWKLFYLPSYSWKWQRYYRTYALIASYLAPLSWPLWKMLKKDRPDVIFTQDYCSGRYDILVLFARLLKVPLVTFHSGSTRDKYLGKSIKHFTIPRADFIFPSGSNEMNMLTTKYKVPGSKQIIIRPPIDVSLYTPMDRTEACQAFNLDPQRRYLIFVGRLDDSVKRLSSIIAVFARLVKSYPQFDLLVVGNGKDEHSLKQQANELAPENVHFLGWISGDREKAQVLNCADSLLLASLREASPAVIGEAFACGVPVISSNVGGIDDLVISNETGWLFTSGDDEGLRSCMEYVMRDPEKIAPIRRNARRMAEEKVSIEAITVALRQGFSTV